MAKYTATVDEDRRQRIHALLGRVHFSAFMRKAITVFVGEIEKNPDLRPGISWKPQSWGTGLGTPNIFTGRTS